MAEVGEMTDSPNSLTYDAVQMTKVFRVHEDWWIRKNFFSGRKSNLNWIHFPKLRWIHYPEWNFDPIFTVFWRCFEWNSTNNSWIGSWVQWIILYQKGNLFLRGSFYHLYQFKHDCIFLDCLDLYIQICSYCTRVRIVRMIPNGKCSCSANTDLFVMEYHDLWKISKVN